MPIDTFPTSGTWTCPTGVTSATFKATGGGAGGGVAANAEGGGGGGSYAEATVSVTAGLDYEVTVGGGGAVNFNGGQSTVEDPDFNLIVQAGGGVTASGPTGGAGGTAGTGDILFSGGAGGNGAPSGTQRGGGGGGAGASSSGAGAAGTSGVLDVPGVGGAGVGTGGSGGDGGASTINGNPGSTLGGGGGGGGNSGGNAAAGARGEVTITYTGSAISATQFEEYNMNRYRIARNSTSNNIGVWIQNSSTSVGLTGLVFNSASLVGSSFKIGTDTARQAVTLAAGTLGSYTSGGFKEVDATNMPGYYQVGVPDALLTGTHRYVALTLSGAADMIPCVVTIEIMDGFNPRDYRRGLPHGFTS